MDETSARADHRLVDSAGAARLLGIPRRALIQLQSEDDGFPSPTFSRGSIRLWDRESVLRWSVAHPAVAGNIWRLPEHFDRQAHDLIILLDLAAARSRELGHGHVGLDHLILAMTRPECPGAALRILRSLGFTYGELGAVLHREADSTNARGGQHVTTASLLVIERAKLWAAMVEDDRVSSEHVLLALTDRWGQSPVMEYLVRRGLDSEMIRERTLALTETPGEDAAASQPDDAGAAGDLDLAPGPDGVDPRERRPWGSIVAVDDAGRPIKKGRALVQYFVDRQGAPVYTNRGELVHLLVDGDGRVVREAGRPRFIPVALPQNARRPHPDG
jgi:hypothetical protein